MSRTVSRRRARERGLLMWRVLVGVTVGMFVLRVVWAVVAAFSADPVGMPSVLWAVAALVAPVALAVYWQPGHRVPNCLFHTGAAAVLLGIGGLGWGSVAAPVISGLTIVGLCLAPGDGGRRARWGRGEAGAR